MLNSIDYLKIRCSYNRIDMMLFSGHFNGEGCSRTFFYRGYKYNISYDKESDTFVVINKNNVPIGILTDARFKFYPSRAPEIGLELLWGFVAKMNIYPVKAS